MVGFEWALPALEVGGIKGKNGIERTLSVQAVEYNSNGR